MESRRWTAALLALPLALAACGMKEASEGSDDGSPSEEETREYGLESDEVSVPDSIPSGTVGVLYLESEQKLWTMDSEGASRELVDLTEIDERLKDGVVEGSIAVSDNLTALSFATEGDAGERLVGVDLTNGAVITLTDRPLDLECAPPAWVPSGRGVSAALIEDDTVSYSLLKLDGSGESIDLRGGCTPQWESDATAWTLDEDQNLTEVTSSGEVGTTIDLRDQLGMPDATFALTDVKGDRACASSSQLNSDILVNLESGTALLLGPADSESWTPAHHCVAVGDEGYYSTGMESMSVEEFAFDQAPVSRTVSEEASGARVIAVVEND
ncbi:hypothetical protein [Salininema proteolyticum]|uniref:Uncharacterized protein n=1 Tax=Salininema proteolyticum TaxID=1607685 RepID=A0ABV8TTC2_9ACTN